MKHSIFFTLLSTLLLTYNAVSGQEKKELTEADRSALENIIVEIYHVSNAKDCDEEVGGKLPKGSITYRIFADLKPGYTLQAVYGSETHPLMIATSTAFFNNTSHGEIKGDYINDAKLNDNTVALDSWVTIGAATKSHMGIPKVDDTDGSIINKPDFKKADGLLLTTKPKAVIYVGVDIESFYGERVVSSLTTTNGSWAVYGGTKGATEDNKILIAQLTTEGILSFDLNIQVGTPGGYNVRYVTSNPQGEEIQFNELAYRR